MTTFEIYDPMDGEVLGEAIELEGGSLSIHIRGNFAGIFKSFKEWNIGKNYSIRKKGYSDNTWGFPFVSHDEDDCDNFFIEYTD